MHLFYPTLENCTTQRNVQMSATALQGVGVQVLPFICRLYLQVGSGCSGKPDILLAGPEDMPVYNIKAR